MIFMTFEMCSIIPCNTRNYRKANRTPDDIQYIVIHYTGNRNDTAEANCRYYQGALPSDRVASAHYFVDSKNIICSVQPYDIAYAVGGSRYASYKTTGGARYYQKCTNSNSISIEVCGGKEIYYPGEKAIKNVEVLTRDLMNYYNVPVENVIRHFDVTGKVCPAWAVNLDYKKQTTYTPEWEKFLTNLREGKSMYTDYEFAKFKELMNGYLEEQDKKPDGWAKDVMTWAAENEIAVGGRPHAFSTRAETLTMIQNYDRTNKEA